MIGCVRIGLAAALLTLVGACSFDAFTYTIARYGSVRPVAVTLRCRDTYEVNDRPQAFALLVGTNAVNEVLAGCIDGGPDMATRMREVVRIFFTETSARPLCTVTHEQQVSPTHREFFYRCPDDPKSSPRLRVVR